MGIQCVILEDHGNIAGLWGEIIDNFAIHIELAGADFQTGITVKLAKSGQNDILCTSVVVVNSAKLTLTCDVTDATVGAWDVIVTNPDEQSGTLSTGLVISTTGGNVTGYAWSDTDGWLSFSCSNDLSCNTVNYGVDIDPVTGLFSGYAWSDNSGWVSFNVSDLTGCPAVATSSPSCGWPLSCMTSATVPSGTSSTGTSSKTTA